MTECLIRILRWPVLPRPRFASAARKVVDGESDTRFSNDFGPASVAYFSGPGDQPATWLNKKTMEEYRPRMKALYYDPAKYDTYLEQLGIKYPTVRTAAEAK
jgi:hypothetical protein